MKFRFNEIDYLRGLAMMAMILIHTTVFYVSNPVAFFLWNYSQWAVPVFIFCSGYIYFQKTQRVSSPDNQSVSLSFRHSGILSFPGILKKRFLRLLIPYYIFLPFFFIVLVITNPHQLTFNYILQSIFLIGGVPVNWLVLLFLQFAILLPILLWIKSRHRILFWTYSFLAVGSSIIFLFWKVPFDWRYIMWLPWSVILLFSFFYVKKRKKNVTFIILVLSFIIYLLSLFTVHSFGHSINFYDNKYPPNLFVISFGIAAISLFYVIMAFVAQNGPINRSIINMLIFLSRYSYSVYFIHYAILLLLSQWVEQLRSIWPLLFFLVFIPTLLIQKLLVIIAINRQ